MLQNQERGVEGLRAELLQSQMTIDDMKAQHTAWVSERAGAGHIGSERTGHETDAVPLGGL